MSADIIARDQLKSIVQRVERLELEIKDLNDDKSEVYKEARASGYDVKAIKKVVQKRKLDENVREEQDLVFDTYWDAVHGTNLVHAHTRENIEEFDAETGDINSRLAKQVVDGMQTEAGRAALIAAVDIMIERDEADEGEAAGNASDLPSNQPETATKSLGDGDFSTVEQNGTATAGTAVTAGETATIPHSSEQPLEGGNDEVAQPQYAATHQAGSPFSISRPAAIPGKLYHEKTPFHPVKRPSYAACFPELTGKDFEDLKADINRNGVIEPILRSFDTILDGFARYEIARSMGIEYPVLEYTGVDPLLDVIKLQRSSRDWTPAQEAIIARALAAELPGRAAEIWAAFHLAPSDEEVIAA